MPLPTQIHRDKALENISIAYMPAAFIADQLIPEVRVQHESDLYYVFSTDHLKLDETVRANGAEANRVTFNMSYSSYFLREHALKDIVTDRDRANADTAIRPDIDATENLTNKILLRKEYDAANLLFDKTNFSNNASLTSTMAFTQDTTLSNPIVQIDSATSKIISSCGMVPNKMIINHDTYVGLKNHQSIVDRVKYTSADSITESMLAKMFTLSQLLVGRAIQDTADVLDTTTMSYIWSNCCMLCYMEPSPGLKKPSAAYKFQSVAKGAPYTVKKWREEELDGDYIEVGTMYQYKAVATQCAYLIVDTA